MNKEKCESMGCNSVEIRNLDVFVVYVPSRVDILDNRNIRQENLPGFCQALPQAAEAAEIERLETEQHQDLEHRYKEWGQGQTLGTSPAHVLRDLTALRGARLTHFDALARSAKKQAEERAMKESEEKAMKEAEEKARKQAAERARKEAEEKARNQAAEKERKEGQEKARKEAGDKAKADAAVPKLSSQGSKKLGASPEQDIQQDVVQVPTGQPVLHNAERTEKKRSKPSKPDDDFELQAPMEYGDHELQQALLLSQMSPKEVLSLTSASLDVEKCEAQGVQSEVQVTMEYEDNELQQALLLSFAQSAVKDDNVQHAILLSMQVDEEEEELQQALAMSMESRERALQVDSM